MSELTQEERRTFNEFCDELINNPNSYIEICEHFTGKDASFEYLFLFQRVKISASISAKALMKTVKEIRAELRAIQANEQQPRADEVRQAVRNGLNGFNDFIGMRGFDDPEPQ